jgi:hypothetical protein
LLSNEFEPPTLQVLIDYGPREARRASSLVARMSIYGCIDFSIVTAATRRNERAI